MRLSVVFPLFFSALLSLPVFAETVTCPSLQTAVQVGSCPSEEELQFTFTGYCSDNARLYKWDEESVCKDYALYRRLKNVVLWEVNGGDFQAYASCDKASDVTRSATPKNIKVEREGKMTRVICGYGDRLSFVYRTKAQCKVEAAGDCSADPSACRASCD